MARLQGHRRIETSAWEFPQFRKMNMPNKPIGAGSETDAYELLGVLPGCTPDELKKAYHKRVAEWHPDRLEGMAGELKEYANRQLALINAAYQRLASGTSSGLAETPFRPKQSAAPPSNDELRNQLEQITRQIEAANKLLEEVMEKWAARCRV
jgi:curved DNA-binding protein CbpA